MANGILLLLAPVITLIISIIPVTICVLVAFYTSSWRRWLAFSLVAIAATIVAFEIYSAFLGGNLTGLIWMLSTPVLAIAILIVYILEKLARRLRQSNK